LQSSSPASSPPATSLSTTRRPSLNPFRISTSTSSTSGVRPLTQSLSQAPASATPDEFGFTRSQKTKRFRGADTGELKRAGMRMFTVKR
jgi:hypothetical protein